MNYNNWRIDGTPEPDLIMGKRYLVKSDITNFFPSIYSHSLPWALIGKPASKINRRTGWYNDIDRYTQYVKNGETHGLLIGPHASNLLSEIILSVIDYNLDKKGWHDYIRHVDDYTCYVKSYEGGRNFISDLTEELHTFDLTMNFKKTSIKELPRASVEQWVRQINAINNISKYEIMKFPDVRAYLDNVIEIMHNSDNKSSILNYAIKVLSRQKMTNNAKDYYIKAILHYSILFPYLIPLLDDYVFKPHKATTCLIEKFTNKIYKDGIHYKNSEEISFSLFFALKYSIHINSISIDEILNTNNCVIFLLSFLYFKQIKNSATCKIIRNHALKLSLSEDDFNQNWVFIYETLPKSSLKGDWKDMKEKQVSFLKVF
jgi:hypothetical protein